MAEVPSNERGLARFARFLVSGAVNTLITYAIYLVLLGPLGYLLSYTVAFVLGVAVAYLLARHFVFRTTRGAMSTALFPAVYVIQYLVSAAAVAVWVSALGLPAQLAPLFGIALGIPITYWLSARLFMRPRVDAS